MRWERLENQKRSWTRIKMRGMGLKRGRLPETREGRVRERGWSRDVLSAHESSKILAENCLLNLMTWRKP